jgi:hypothetical protein
MRGVNPIAGRFPGPKARKATAAKPTIKTTIPCTAQSKPVSPPVGIRPVSMLGCTISENSDAVPPDELDCGVVRRPNHPRRSPR